jgi:hypothetical protein
MTIIEKALEQTLHGALAAKDMSRIRDVYDQGADLITGVFQQSSGKLLCCIINRAIG